jgi:hypothetical protein
MNHKNISLAKSLIRILAGISLVGVVTTLHLAWLVWAGILLIVAEILGIFEELV